MLFPISTINCRGRLTDISRPVVMGILNLGPNSFYDGGKFVDPEMVLIQVDRMIEEGATIIDVGGTTSRPGSDLPDIETEIKRVVPVIKGILQKRKEAIVSIDTYRFEVAHAAIEAGASMINDIYGGRYDDRLPKLAAETNTPYIAMHMQGDPQSMQDNPQYDDVALTVLDFMIQRVEDLRRKGVIDILIDPGFGFGKSVDHNYELLKKLEVLQILDVPVAVGLSRKSMIYKFLNSTADDALSATSALHMFALSKGARLLRVHDVKEACEVIQLWEKINET